MSEDTKRLSLDEIQELMKTDPKKARVEAVSTARAEDAALKAALKAGDEAPATPVKDWMTSDDYQNRKTQSASGKGGGNTTKNRLDSDVDRQNMVKDAVAAGARTAGAVRRFINDKGFACSTDWIAPMLLGILPEGEPKTTKVVAAEKAPAAKKAATPKKAPAAKKSATPKTDKVVAKKAAAAKKTTSGRPPVNRSSVNPLPKASASSTKVAQAS